LHFLSYQVAARKAPANVWTYPKHREKLKHLVANPPCTCGAGRSVQCSIWMWSHTAYRMTSLLVILN